MVDMAANLGIIGIGELAEFILHGLRRAGDQRPVFLSPRNAERAARLAQECRAEKSASNQAVLDAAELILVAVPPKDVYATIGALTWQPHHVLVCVAIDVDCAGLQRHAPAARIVRAMPSSCLAVNRGGTPIFPAAPMATALFENLGDVVVLETEAQFETAAALASYYLWSFAIIDAVAEQAIAQGLPPALARGLTASLTAGAAAVAAAQPDLPARATLDRYALAGTMTRQGLEVLQAGGAIEPWRAALDIAINRMRQGRSQPGRD
jgi:pyrroline-5-carboxylate reductase